MVTSDRAPWRGGRMPGQVSTLACAGRRCHVVLGATLRARVCRNGPKRCLSAAGACGPAPGRPGYACRGGGPGGARCGGIHQGGAGACPAGPVRGAGRAALCACPCRPVWLESVDLLAEAPGRFRPTQSGQSSQPSRSIRAVTGEPAETWADTVPGTGSRAFVAPLPRADHTAGVRRDTCPPLPVLPPPLSGSGPAHAAPPGGRGPAGRHCGAAALCAVRAVRGGPAHHPTNNVG